MSGFKLDGKDEGRVSKLEPSGGKSFAYASMDDVSARELHKTYVRWLEFGIEFHAGKPCNDPASLRPIDLARIQAHREK